MVKLEREDSNLHVVTKRYTLISKWSKFVTTPGKQPGASANSATPQQYKWLPRQDLNLRQGG